MMRHSGHPHSFASERSWQIYIKFSNRVCTESRWSNSVLLHIGLVWFGLEVQIKLHDFLKTELPYRVFVHAIKYIVL